MTEKFLTNVSEVEIVLTLLGLQGEAYLAWTGRQPWREDFYEKYNMFTNGTINYDSRLFQIWVNGRWDEYRRDLIDYLSNHPEHPIEYIDLSHWL